MTIFLFRWIPGDQKISPTATNCCLLWTAHITVILIALHPPTGWNYFQRCLMSVYQCISRNASTREKEKSVVLKPNLSLEITDQYNWCHFYFPSSSLSADNSLKSLRPFQKTQFFFCVCGFLLWHMDKLFNWIINVRPRENSWKCNCHFREIICKRLQ